MKNVNKEKREMIKELIYMENFIYNDMLKNLDLIDFDDLSNRYLDVYFIYTTIKEVNLHDRNSS